MSAAPSAGAAEPPPRGASAEAEIGNPREERRYRRAALVYAVGALVVVGWTLAAPGLAGPDRRAEVAHLLAALPFVALAAAAVAAGDRAVAAALRLARVPAGRAARLGAHAREKLVMLLTLTSALRLAVFAGALVGWRPALEPVLPFVALERRPPVLAQLPSVIAMAAIVLALGRASWGSWWRRRALRPPEPRLGDAKPTPRGGGR